MDYAVRLGREPGRVVLPTTVEEAAAVVAQAAAAGQAVIPWGGGTGQGYGYLPRRADIVLDLSRLNRVLAHEPGDMTVTVEGGVTLQALGRKLAGQRQFLPLDPPHPERATIGGILATDARGVTDGSRGTARDMLIGIAVIDARGQIVRGGGKVVKNVTGYDLPKLHIGALGTLGIIVEATFKVSPLPEQSVLMRYPVPPGSPIGDLLLRLHHDLSPALAVLLDSTVPRPGAAPARHLFIGFDGAREAVQDCVSAAAALAERAGLGMGTRPAAEERAEFAHPSAGSPRLRIRFSGMPGASAALHDAVAAMGVWEWVRTVAGAGHTEAGLRMGEDATAVALQAQEWARQHGIHLVLLHAPDTLRESGDIDIWSPLPPSLPLMRRLKEKLDPKGTLNPGRFIGKI